MYTPPAPNAPAPARDTPVNPNAVALLDNLERLRLDFETILPLHGGTPATRADLYAFVERPLVPISALPVPESEETEADAPVSAADASLLELVETACSACHSVERVNSTRADRDTWASTVARMVDNGAAITDEEAALIIDFLARTLSP